LPVALTLGLATGGKESSSPEEHLMAGPRAWGLSLLKRLPIILATLLAALAPHGGVGLQASQPAGMLMNLPSDAAFAAPSAGLVDSDLSTDE
jgi:hypothetical protein